MKLIRWVVPAVMLLLVILCATHVAPEVLAYTVIPALAVVTMIAGWRAERRLRPWPNHPPCEWRMEVLS